MIQYVNNWSGHTAWVSVRADNSLHMVIDSGPDEGFELTIDDGDLANNWMVRPT